MGLPGIVKVTLEESLISPRFDTRDLFDRWGRFPESGDWHLPPPPQVKDALRNVVARIKLLNPAFPVKLDVDPVQDNLLTVTWFPLGRDDGKEARITQRCALPMPALFDTPGLERFIRELVRAVFMHEFQECYHLDGVRAEEPHPNGPGGNVLDWRRIVMEAP